VRPRANVIIGSLGSRLWGINWYQNEWPWPFFRGLRSCHPLRHICHCISQKPLYRDRLGSKGPPKGNGLWRVPWSHDRWCHV